MASKLVVDAVLARAAGFTRCPIIGPNDRTADPPVDGSPFLSIQFPVANEEHISLGMVGQRTFRENGGIRFVLSVGRGDGLAQALQWIDEIRALFRAAQFGGVNCLTASPAQYLDDGNESGQFYRLSCVVEYYADILA